MYLKKDEKKGALGLVSREKYLKEKKKGFRTIENPDIGEYEKKIKRHRMKNILIIIGVIAVVFIIVGINILKEKTKVYGDYDIESTLADANAVNNNFFKYKNGIIEVSRDGISYIEGKQTIWNYAYEIKNPIYAVCDNYIAVGDTLGTKVYIFNESGYKSETDVYGTPTDIAVTNTGCIIVCIEENTTNYIYMYSQDTQIYKIKTDISGGGYPLAMASSKDGQKLVVSYLYIDGKKMMTKVVFYNFSGVGQNESERAVGAWHYEDTIIPKVQFTDNDTVVLLGDNMISVYDYRQIPENRYEVNIEHEIKKAFIENGYIGIVYNLTDSNNSHELCVYSTSKQKPVLKYAYNEDYTEYMVAEDYIMMYNTSACRMINFNGSVKFDYTFKNIINRLVKTDSHNQFYLIADGSIRKIRLK